MAKQKPKAKVVSSTRPKYPQAELKKIGQPYNYDAIAFKNSQIDAIKGKMNAFVEEWGDIVPESSMPKRPEMSSREFPLRRPASEGWPNNTMIDFSKRTGYTQRAYGPVVGDVTGKKGVSKKEYAKYKNLMQAYRDDPSLDTNISDTVYQNQLDRRLAEERIKEGMKARKK